MQNGCYVTLESSEIDNKGMIATPYPVSWELEVDPYDSVLWRIRWPRSPYVFDLPDINGHVVQLSNSYPFKPTRLWRLIPVENPEANDVLEFTTTPQKELTAAPPVVTTADTVVDVEGLKLGGNGEMSITTTTTTVTTSVTKIKRLGIP
ncbi:hypothetical protein GALMADRAFT_253957 [Galerina marginata CBS 339.88]|uniref:Uncharacterized protein n=1 Tax=Galerina marginata (strain CBS 339.88) TaxID=685588 RepID=A0A067SKX6_GALM3|nr:hypothetical protein GALMADRAFT_253957 [Galerina marginata CBS 339.88]